MRYKTYNYYQNLKKKATSEEAMNFKIKMHALLHFAKIEQFNYYHNYNINQLRPCRFEAINEIGNRKSCIVLVHVKRHC